MAVTAATPIAGAQVLLNDAGGTNYTSAALIPLVQKAYRELQIKFQKAGLSQTKKVTAPVLTIAPGTIVVGDGSGLPLDFLYPINLWEGGSLTGPWYLMTEREWEPLAPQNSTLQYYAWREEALNFIGATAIRYVLVQYMKGLTAITATSSPLQIDDCDLFLAARCAAIAALVIGENPTRAQALDQDAARLWDDLKGTRVKSQQSLPVRRRVNRYRR